MRLFALYFLFSGWCHRAAAPGYGDAPEPWASVGGDWRCDADEAFIRWVDSLSTGTAVSHNGDNKGGKRRVFIIAIEVGGSRCQQQFIFIVLHLILKPTVYSVTHTMPTTVQCKGR